MSISSGENVMSSLNLWAFCAMPWDLDRLDCAISLLGKPLVTRNLGLLAEVCPCWICDRVQQTVQQTRKPSHINQGIFNSLRASLRWVSPPYGAPSATNSDIDFKGFFGEILPQAAPSSFGGATNS